MSTVWVRLEIDGPPRAAREAVRAALVKAGVPEGRLTAKGYGAADPVASNDNEEGRFRNRRIEYHIVQTP